MQGYYSSLSKHLKLSFFFMILISYSEGKWKVSVVTSALRVASTTAKVSINVYGTKESTGPIMLINDSPHPNFKSGNEDIFFVSLCKDIIEEILSSYCIASKESFQGLKHSKAILLDMIIPLLTPHFFIDHSGINR